MSARAKVVIGGAGSIGRHIAALLEEDEYDVVLIDHDPQALKEVGESLDIQLVEGHACSPQVLEKAGVQDAALMLALTDQDEVNLLAAFSAKQLGARKTVARARSAWCLDSSLVDFRLRFQIDMLLNPEVLTAVEMMKFLDNPDALALTHFAQGKVQLRQFTLTGDSVFVNRALKECRLPGGVLVVMRSDGEKVEIPRGDTVLKAGDRLTIMGQPGQIPEAQRLFRLPADRARSIAIAGAGNTGFFLAQTLEPRKFNVKLIEIDEERCHYVSERLERTRVIRGDATQVGFMMEERINLSDVFIAATDSDETNLMSCLLAKEMGVRLTMSKVTRPDYARLIGRVGVDLAISPRMVVADRILAMVRRGKVQAVSILEGGKVEAVEFVAQAGTAVVNRPLRETPIPAKCLIGAIVRRGAVKVPRGDDEIRPGDTVIALALEEAMDELETLFSPQEV